MTRQAWAAVGGPVGRRCTVWKQSLLVRCRPGAEAVVRENIVYVLGAGFSAPLGLPVMSNFLMRSKDLFAEDPERFAHFEGVFQEIRKMAQAKNYLEIDLSNIEQILSILDMEEYAGGPAHRDAFIRFLADTVSALTPSTHVPQFPEGLPGDWEGRLFSEKGEVRAYCTWLAGLFGVSIRATSATGVLDFAEDPEAGADFSIISLNYDMVLETCLDLINSQVSPRGKLSFRGTVQGDGIPFAKLHGSVEGPTIVPPTWQKHAGEPVRDAWELAVHLLNEANEIRILGFSFPETDGYMKYLLALGAMRAPHLKSIDTICLDPTGEVERRYRDFISFGAFRFLSKDLVGYVGSYGGRTDERVVGEWHGHKRVRFQGLDTYHRRFVGRDT